MDWSREEIEAVVADYLQMLTTELAGPTYNKTEHRLQLQTMLNNRSNGSIEFKRDKVALDQHCTLDPVTYRASFA